MAQRFNNEIGKAPYSAPKLAIYGEFSQLTGAGAKGSPEGKTSAASKKP